MTRRRKGQAEENAEPTVTNLSGDGMPDDESTEGAEASSPSGEPAGDEDRRETGESVPVETQPAPGEDMEAKCRELNDRLLRTKAEFENYRKRVQREFAEIRQQTKNLTVEEFLAVYDHFQMALAHSDQTDDIVTLRQGIRLIQNEFDRAFSNLGIESLDASGQPFDPEVHEAIAQEASDMIPEGHVVRQWKLGFRSAGKLLRPATVVVSSGPSGSGEATSGRTEDQEQ